MQGKNRRISRRVVDPKPRTKYRIGLQGWHVRSFRFWVCISCTSNLWPRKLRNFVPIRTATGVWWRASFDSGEVNCTYLPPKIVGWLNKNNTKASTELGNAHSPNDVGQSPLQLPKRQGGIYPGLRGCRDGTETPHHYGKGRSSTKR